MDGTQIAWTIIACTVVIWPTIGRFRKRKEKLANPQPICGCKHHRSYHEEGKGICHAQVKGKPIHYDTWNDPNAWEKIQCTCQHYTGPEPLPEFYVPEISE